MPGVVGLAALAALAALAGLATWLTLRYARHRLVDEPGERRSHTVPTPRGGGLGIVGVLLFFLLNQFGGTNLGGVGSIPGLSLDQVSPGQQVQSDELRRKCRTGADANRDQDCAVVAVINSIQD